MLVIESITDCRKKFHGKRAQRTKTGNLGMLLSGIMKVKTIVKTVIIARGFRRDQRNPRRELL
jgi:hypothetical protein